MRKFRWLLIPAAIFWLTGYEAQSLDDCLAETTFECAMDQAILAAGKIGKQSERATAYTFIARVYADTGHDDNARQYLALVSSLKREVMEPGWRDAISAHQARVHALLSEFDEALAFTEGIRDTVALVRAWSWIAEIQATAGDNAGANRSIERALASAAELPEEQMAPSLAMMAIAKAHAGARDEALAAATAALELSSRYGDDLWQSRVAALAAVAQAAAGERDQAAESLALAAEILSRLVEGNTPIEQQASAQAVFAVALTRVGDGESARARLPPLKEMIREMPRHYSRSVYLSAVALVLVKAD